MIYIPKIFLDLGLLFLMLMLLVILVYELSEPISALLRMTIGRIPYRWWPQRLMCAIGIHYSGTDAGGGMGDAHICDHCKLDRYGVALILHKGSHGASHHG